jgi:glutamate synthase domain-containing protein 1
MTGPKTGGRSVLYNAAGTNISASSIDREKLPLFLLVDHKLYWISCDTEEEGHYLAAVLNSSSVNEAIKPFQSMGLLGERDIHKKVLDVPIPAYQQKQAKHRDLAALGEMAQAEVESIVGEPAFPVSLARRRSAVRDRIKGTLEEIDAIVRTLI